MHIEIVNQLTCELLALFHGLILLRLTTPPAKAGYP